jgi:hypothetical protein
MSHARKDTTTLRGTHFSLSIVNYSFLTPPPPLSGAACKYGLTHTGNSFFFLFAPYLSLSGAGAFETKSLLFDTEAGDSGVKALYFTIKSLPLIKKAVPFIVKSLLSIKKALPSIIRARVFVLYAGFFAKKARSLLLTAPAAGVYYPAPPETAGKGVP